MADEDPGLDVDPSLFEDVKYYISGSLDEQIVSFLNKGGASQKIYLSSTATHVIAAQDADETELQDAFSLHEVPVVRSEWITQSVRSKTKLPISCFGYFHPKPIFSGLQISTSGLSRADEKRVWAMVTSRRGIINWELRPSTTHLVIGGNLCSQKRVAAENSGRPIPIVTPDWVTESLKSDTLLPPEDFHPRLMLAEGQVFVPKRRKKKKEDSPPEEISPQPAPVVIVQPSVSQSNNLAQQNRLLLQQLQIKDQLINANLNPQAPRPQFQNSDIGQNKEQVPNMGPSKSIPVPAVQQSPVNPQEKFLEQKLQNQGAEPQVSEKSEQLKLASTISGSVPPQQTQDTTNLVSSAQPRASPHLSQTQVYSGVSQLQPQIVQRQPSMPQLPQQPVQPSHLPTQFINHGQPPISVASMQPGIVRMIVSGQKPGQVVQFSQNPNMQHQQIMHGQVIMQQGVQQQPGMITISGMQQQPGVITISGVQQQHGLMHIQGVQQQAVMVTQQQGSLQQSVVSHQPVINQSHLQQQGINQQQNVSTQHVVHHHQQAIIQTNSFQQHMRMPVQVNFQNQGNQQQQSASQAPQHLVSQGITHQLDPQQTVTMLHSGTQQMASHQQSGTPQQPSTPQSSGTPQPPGTPINPGTPMPSVTPQPPGTPLTSVTPQPPGTPLQPGTPGTPAPSVTPTGSGTPAPPNTPGPLTVATMPTTSLPPGASLPSGLNPGNSLPPGASIPMSNLPPLSASSQPTQQLPPGAALPSVAQTSGMPQPGQHQQGGMIVQQGISMQQGAQQQGSPGVSNQWQQQAPRQQWIQQPDGQRYAIPQQGWVQQRPNIPGQMVVQRQRQVPPHLLRQQHIVQQHLSTLTPDEKAKFHQMTPREKQQYLLQRGLLLPPQTNQSITLTEEQREIFQRMNPAERTAYLQKLHKEAQLRQQLQRQQQLQQQQQQQQPGVQMGSVQMTQQQQPTQQQSGQVQWQQPQTAHFISPEGVRVTGSPMGVRMQLRVTQPQGVRPQWSGETHPALAQVPHTPQQLQHLHRLQQQREQQQLEQIPLQQSNVIGGPRPGIPMVMSQAPQQIGTGLTTPPLQPFTQPVDTAVMPSNGQSNQPTKVALQTMLNNRMQQPGQVIQQPQTLVRPMAPQIDGNPHLTLVGDPSGRLQMMPPQQGSTQHMMPSPVAPLGHMYNRPAPPVPGGPQQGYISPQRRPLDAMGQMHSSMAPPSMPPYSMAGGRFVNPRMTMGQMRGQIAHAPRFYGHDPNTKLPPDLCLLGCIFVICDYAKDPEESILSSNWKKVIRHYGGEVEETYQARITHVLCKNQDSPFAVQGLREGKRLVTAFWLNDVVVIKKVVHPWKGIHFPLPPKFEPPCKNMILTLTGFKERERDWVKEMIKISGAKFTSYFSKHNNVIICKSNEGDKFLKAKEWKVPAVSAQWLNDVLFGSIHVLLSTNNPKYQTYKLEDSLKIDYALVQNLLAAWKMPIRVTPETYEKFKANPPSRLKRKSEHRQDIGSKKLKEAEEPKQLSDIKQELSETASQQSPNPESSTSQAEDFKPGIDSVKSVGASKSEAKQNAPTEGGVENHVNVASNMQFNEVDNGVQSLERKLTPSDCEKTVSTENNIPSCDDDSKSSNSSLTGNTKPLPLSELETETKGSDRIEESELKKDIDDEIYPPIKTELLDTESKVNGPTTEPGTSKSDIIVIKEEPMETDEVNLSSQNGHLAKPNCSEGNDIKPNISVAVMLSGFSESFTKLAKKYCSSLGLTVTSQPKSATHLVMPRIIRTIRFLCAINHVKFILTPDWLRESFKAKRLLGESNFILRDEKFDKMYKCSILKTLRAAQQRKLFQGRTFYLTPSIQPNWRDIKNVIESAGGIVDNRRRKSIEAIRLLNRTGFNPTYLIITCEDDLHLVTDVLKAKVGVYNTEFIFSSVIKGKMNFDLSRYITTIKESNTSP